MVKKTIDLMELLSKLAKEEMKKQSTTSSRAKNE